MFQPLFLQSGKLGAVEAAVKDQGQQTGKTFGQEEGQPDQAGGEQTQHQRCGQEKDHLPQQGEDQTEHGTVQGLEGGAEDDAYRRKHEGKGYQPQGGHAVGQDGGVGVEQAQQRAGNEQEQQRARRQETCGDDQGKVDQACNPFALLAP